jgi:hypothetical protein
MRRAFLMCVVAAACCLGWVSTASAAVTPGWECVPAAAGSAVVSGGTGNAPSCATGSTAVLAPTYVSAGVGGKPTVAFSAVNVQVVSGSGSTDGPRNGEGNLVVGYAENPNSLGRTGSNNLIVGSKGGWTGYGDLVAGLSDQATNTYSAVFGNTNIARGSGELLAGSDNSATGKNASITGGQSNGAAGAESAVTGGRLNYARDPASSVTGGCQNMAGSTDPLAGTCPSSGVESVTGGQHNTASGPLATVAGGDHNTAGDPFATVPGGGDGSSGPLVYQLVNTGSSPIILGPQSDPTYLGATAAMQPGTYLVQYSVGVTMGPSGNVVCAASTTPGGNDGIFGTVGNGATNSGTGPDGIYGEASAVDTITVTAGQSISLTCNVGNYGQGTYTGSWSLTATKIGALDKTTP